MALEPITRQEKIIAGQDLTPITRLEKFLKNFGGSGGGGGTFIVNVTVADDGATCTADKTFAEMEEAYLSGKVLKVVEKQTTPYAIELVYDLDSYILSPEKVLSFVNIAPGGVNFHFYNIMIAKDMAIKMTYTMTGEFAP